MIHSGGSAPAMDADVKNIYIQLLFSGNASTPESIIPIEPFSGSVRVNGCIHQNGLIYRIRWSGRGCNEELFVFIGSTEG